MNIDKQITGNCKVVTFGNNTNIDSKQNIDNALRNTQYPAVFVHPTVKAIAEMILKEFEVYYAMKVPIGYSGGFQYHILIKNPHCSNNNFKPGYAESMIPEVKTVKVKVEETPTLKPGKVKPSIEIGKLKKQFSDLFDIKKFKKRIDAKQAFEERVKELIND